MKRAVLLSVLLVLAALMVPCQADPLAGNSMSGYGSWSIVPMNFLGGTPNIFNYDGQYYYYVYYFNRYDGHWHYFRVYLW